MAEADLEQLQRGLVEELRRKQALSNPGGGLVHCFGSSAAFMKMGSLLDSWRSHNTTLLDRIRLKLIPKALGHPSDGAGKLFTRDAHSLQVWLD